MKYRRLRIDELEELESEFVRFLAAQAITGPDWVKIKEVQPQRAEKLIEQFSDMVFEQVLKNVEFLEIKKPKELKIFKCLDDRIILMGLIVEGQTRLDLTQNLPPARMMEQLQASDAKIKLFRAERRYREGRERDLFELMEKGALISKDPTLYETLASLRRSKPEK
ncbi:MAG: DUF6495 family protein [Saprospiraceae bacterium]|nr:DUF6495 family protein [Saprospiraceae bacterium]